MEKKWRLPFSDQAGKSGVQNLETKSEEARKTAATGIGPATVVNRRRKSKGNAEKEKEKEKEDAPGGAEQQIHVADRINPGPPGPLPYTDRVRTFRELMSNVDSWPGRGNSIPDGRREFEYLLQGYTHIRLTNLNNIREQLHSNPRVTREVIEEQPDDMLEILAQTVRVLIPPRSSKATLVDLCCDRYFWGDRLGGDPGHNQDQLPRSLHMPKENEEREVERTPPPPPLEPATHNLSAMQPRTLAFTAHAPAAAAARDGNGNGRKKEMEISRKEGADVPLALTSIPGRQGVKRGETEPASGGQEKEKEEEEEEEVVAVVVGLKGVEELLGSMTERYRKVRREREADEIEMEGLKTIIMAEESRVKECRGLLEAAERDVTESEKQRKVLEERRDGRRRSFSEAEMGAATLTAKLEGMQKVLIRSMEREIEVGDVQTELEDLVNREHADMKKRARRGDGSNCGAGYDQKVSKAQKR